MENVFFNLNKNHYGGSEKPNICNAVLSQGYKVCK